ncbi:site-specific recombinase XerD [Gracilibacillus halotolerans]|uniref:Site-specific recombinase XerD n=1 Tax=Gracilibacillus halotolerans TaxID=74386 RepID=A0A841RKF5_9BACI|nr:tyrosine-type recombinase/integrase [Gracilibacillus halotolerans]MBB6512113.1 site-specific recombinase XerD [Gracilibacillus halotolerans]
MEYVVPIKDIRKINEMKNILKKSSKRDYCLFVLGINTGIKAQDLLTLKVKDVWENEKPKEFLTIKNRKSGALVTHYLNVRVHEALHLYLDNGNLLPEDFLFRSRRDTQPITRQQAYRIINHAAREVGLDGNIGTHTLRKTFGYHAYRKGVAISILMSLFHHHSRSETLKYIGITEEEKNLIKVDVNL